MIPLLAAQAEHSRPDRARRNDLGKDFGYPFHDKAITVTRFQLVLGTAGAGCTTQSTVSVTDSTNAVTLTTANGTAIYDSGAVSRNFAATANLDIKIATAASGCTTAPQNANVTVQYRMQ